MTVEVHIVDDDDAMRDSLAFLLKTAGFAPVTHESAAAFIAALPAARPGCLVTDIRMPGMSGMDLLGEIARRGHRFPVIVITGHGDVPIAVEAMKRGAADFVEKPFEDDKIISAIIAACQRLPSGEESARGEIEGRLASLSARERQVLDGLIAGKANKTIALDLGISPRTVEVYRANVMSKMQAGSLSELVRMTLRAEA
jgi:two-component system, LuxR family, response regulator FixJ